MCVTINHTHFNLKITHYTMTQDNSKPDNFDISKLSEREIIEALWALLDNIDTLSDICKPTLDNPKAAMAFYSNAMRYANERFKYMQSDGYKIYTYDEFKKLPKQNGESYQPINK